MSHMPHLTPILRDRAIIRLALTYLLIIMTLCVSFSAFFYYTSSHSLQVTVADTPDGSINIAQQQPVSHTPSPAEHLTDKHETTTGNTPDQIQTVTASLEQKVSDIQRRLRLQLFVYNMVALFVAGCFSLFLAYRTLEPMQAAMRQQRRFVADASHELRTPLAVMQAEVDVVLANNKLTLPRAVEAIKSYRTEVARLRSLSETLLQLTQATEAIASPRHAASVSTIITDAVRATQSYARTRRIMLEVGDIPSARVMGDPSALSHAITILLDNACKYSPEGTKVYIGAEQLGKRLTIQVRDAGIGIAAKDLPHVFERFYRADAVRSHSSTEGYGLGLSIAQAIIVRHGGHIAVHSTPGVGSVFSVVLPTA